MNRQHYDLTENSGDSPWRISDVVILGFFYFVTLALLAGWL